MDYSLKESTALKLIDKLHGKTVEFSANEITALGDGRLNKLLVKIAKDGFDVPGVASLVLHTPSPKK